MGRALGINAILRAGFESTYGTPPAGTAFHQVPFVSSAIGEEQALLDDDELGGGREGFDPVPDVVNNAGDIVVPVDTDAIGVWLKALLGAPTSTGTGTFTHTFNSGSVALPSLSLEVGNPEVPSFSTNYGAVANSMRIAMARSGLLNATMSMIAQGEQPHAATSIAAAAALVRGSRFAQAAGQVSMGGSALGNVVSTDFTFSNGLDTVENIRSDGRIDGVDPGKISMTGTLTVRFADNTLMDAATSGAPVSINFGWTRGPASLLFTLARVYLPKPKRPITGPGGIQSTFNIRASGAGGHTLSAVLVNSMPATTYA